MSKQTIGGGTTPPFPQAARAGDVEAILAEAGCTMTDVVRCTCWIDDPRDSAAPTPSTPATSATTRRPARPC
ncbi:MAG: RidA family protein [Geminicoccaceae bacterium]